MSLVTAFDIAQTGVRGPFVPPRQAACPLCAVYDDLKCTCHFTPGALWAQ